jgi:hypothetical protein
MTVDDAGFRRVHGGDTSERRLESRGRGGIDDLDTFDAIDLRLLKERLQPRQFVGIGGDDELAAFAVGHAVRGAERVEHAPAARAVIGAPRFGGIVKAGVDHFAVARGDAGADAGGRFRHHHGVPGERGGARHRQPHHARSDHQHLHPRRLAHSSTGSPA